MTDPDRTEDWLREGLAGAVPDPPGSPDRAAAARGRARRARRRTTIGAAAGVVASLAVVGVVSTSLRDGSSRDDTAAAPSSPFDVPGCPTDDPAGPNLEADSSAPADVPSGAVSVRMCQGPGTPVDVPADALVTKVGTIVAAVNELETTPAPEMCPADIGPGYRLVFGYDGGRTFVVTGELSKCRIVQVGSTLRGDSRAPWDRFFALLQEQRDRLDPPPLPAAPDGCDAGWDMAPGATPLGRPEDLAVAALCISDGSGDPSERAEIAQADLQILVSDVAAHTAVEQQALDCRAGPTFVRIVGLTAWGDRVSLRDQCSLDWFSADGDPSGRVWHPGREGEAVLERLVAEAE